MSPSITEASLLELMQNRRSIRRFKPQMPSRQQIEQLIAAAITAPSASNKQPWRFCVISDASILSSLAGEVQKVLDQLLTQLDDAARKEVEAYGRYFVRFLDAPVVIAPFFRPLTVLSHLLDSGSANAKTRTISSRVLNLEQMSGMVSTSLAVQNLLLSAQAAGLGASCMTGPLLAAPEIGSLLQMGRGWQLTCLIALGYSDEAPTPPSRKEPSTITRWMEPAHLKEVL